MNDIQFVVFSFKNLETSKIHAFFSFFYNENKKKHYIAIEKLTISIKLSTDKSKANIFCFLECFKF